MAGDTKAAEAAAATTKNFFIKKIPLERYNVTERGACDLFFCAPHREVELTPDSSRLHVVSNLLTLRKHPQNG
jgi:hypothetical protein